MGSSVIVRPVGGLDDLGSKRCECNKCQCPLPPKSITRMVYAVAVLIVF